MHSSNTNPFEDQIRLAFSEDENSFFSEETEWIEQSATRLTERLINLGLAAAPSITNGNKPGKSILNSLITPFLAFAIMIVVTATAFTLANLNEQAFIADTAIPLGSPAFIQEDDARMQGGIIFNNNGICPECINLLQAIIQADSDYGELTVNFWKITEPSSEDIIYSGKSEAMDSIFAEMSEKGLTGQYILCFSMEDPAGGTYDSDRHFVLINYDLRFN